MRNPVLTTTGKVIKNSEKVFINLKALEFFTDKYGNKIAQEEYGNTEEHLISDNEDVIADYWVLVDALNFCFWPEKGSKWKVRYKGKDYSGYFGLSMALKRFFEEKQDKANWEYLSEITFNDFSSILRGRGDLQFMEERHTITKLLGNFILERYNGRASDFIKSAGGRADNFVLKTVKELPYFDDEAKFEGRKVYFWKRAQILAADLHNAFKRRGLGGFENMDFLTAFADYRLPQILNHLGILEYEEKLAEKIYKERFIKAGSKEEVEIRSATIWAVELIRQSFKKKGRNISTLDIDGFLWPESKRRKIKMPCHKTKTMRY